MVSNGSAGADSFLGGIRVLEVADELGEYAGKVLAGLGADVLKVEPPDGEVTRRYGPFYKDVEDPNRSLYFWHYNFGKRGITLDFDSADGQALFRRLAATADIIIDTRDREYMAARGLGYDDLKAHNPGLVYVRISPFGDDGPWADYKACDLVHLALGGVAMNCGYDPDPSGFYDTPPIAPQMWQAYHIAGEMAALGAIAALNHRLEAGVGQALAIAVHEAVSKNTETDLPNWVYQRNTHYRQTCRHSAPERWVPFITTTKDGRWVMPYRTYLPSPMGNGLPGTVRVLQKHGMELDLADEQYSNTDYVRQPAVAVHIGAVIDRFIGSYKFSKDVWRDAQMERLPWAPLRRPEENLAEGHWKLRETFFEVEHPELGQTFPYIGAKWLAQEVPWRKGPRAPLLGEHTQDVIAELGSATAASAGAAKPVVPTPMRRPGTGALSKRGKPFALSGVRIIDLSWLLASGGAARFFTSLGAEVIKVEHDSRPDGMRFGHGVAPEGGRAAREAATGPLRESTGINRGGSFGEINAGKRSVSLNLKHPRSKELLCELIKDADMVIEGFSPGTMERMGLGYDRLREINPRIIYAQQSGMGQAGTYGAMRSYGPTAAAICGISEMSGLPEPYPPAGIGYSYLDWFGAYNLAMAMMAALYRQRTTGKGCYVDSSQAEAGFYLTGTAILDFAVNGRRWSRYGNRSPYKPAAPHGVYRAAGADRWIAVGCFTDDQWAGLVRVLGDPEWARDGRFSSLERRLANQDDLDGLINSETESWDVSALMHALQAVGTPAGVCQNAQDRYEADPQLSHLEWLIELTQTEIGIWPVKEFPVHFSETPAYMGGQLDRHGPNYGEDNDYVLRDLLGLDDQEIRELAEDGGL